MKITQCYPIITIAGEKNQKVIDLFVGFMKLEHQTEVDGRPYYVVVDANGNHMDVLVTEGEPKASLWGYRYNTDDIQEAKKEFEKAGTVFEGDIEERPKYFYLIGKGALGINALIFQHKHE